MDPDNDPTRRVNDQMREPASRMGERVATLGGHRLLRAEDADPAYQCKDEQRRAQGQDESTATRSTRIMIVVLDSGHATGEVVPLRRSWR